MIYSYLGVEVIAITAFEARDLPSLRVPSKWIAYIVFVLYLLVTIGELLNVSWLNNDLPPVYGGISMHQLPKPRTRTIILLTALQARCPNIAGLFNGALLYSAISAANTNLYISSRTLYGMTRRPGPHFRWLSALGSVWHKNGVPMVALLISALFFMWLPIVAVRGGYSIADLTEFMNVNASVSCLLVWASQCFAFIRYYTWTQKHKDALAKRLSESDGPNFSRRTEGCKTSTLLDRFQPVPAWFGLIACLVIVVVFPSGTWWSTPFSFQKFAVAYGSLLLLGALFLVSKVVTRRSPVKLDDNPTVLIDALHELTYKKPGRRPQSTEYVTLKRVLQWVLVRPGSPRHSTAHGEHNNMENGHIS